MPRECPACRSEYPSDANYCAICGRTLVLATAPPGGRGVLMVLGLIVSAAITYGVFAATGPSRKVEPMRLDLPAPKAEAIFELLRPNNVRAIVRWEGRIVDIRGTRRECDTVAAFAAILMRCNLSPMHDVDHCMAHERKTWNTRKTYKLSGHMAKVLYETLAPEDVPVLVQRSGTKVTISANVRDQETVSRFVDILRGKRL